MLASYYELEMLAKEKHMEALKQSRKGKQLQQPSKVHDRRAEARAVSLALLRPGSCG